MNTARAFGPAVVTGFDFPGHSKHWVVCPATAKRARRLLIGLVLGWSLSGLPGRSSLLYAAQVVSDSFVTDRIPG